jgi:hypothetical protein
VDKDYKIKMLENEIDDLYDQLFELKSKQKTFHLKDAYNELVFDLHNGIRNLIEKYNEEQDEEVPKEQFIENLKLFDKYIKEFKRAYKI